jgi:hypothetical protein
MMLTLTTLSDSKRIAIDLLRAESIVEYGAGSKIRLNENNEINQSFKQRIQKPKF